MIRMIGTDIWTRLRATCRSPQVRVVVSYSTQPRCRAGSRPPKAYQSHRCGAGRTTGSVAPSGSAAVPVMTFSCSTELMLPFSARMLGAPTVGVPSVARSSRHRGGLQRSLGGGDHLGQRRVQGHQVLDRHAEAFHDAGGDLLRLVPPRPPPLSGDEGQGAPVGPGAPPPPQGGGRPGPAGG